MLTSFRTTSFHTIEQLAVQASELMARPGFRFSDFASLFSRFDREQACLIFNNILNEILNKAEKEGKPAYSEQMHLIVEDDFHLCLKLSGEGHAQQEQEQTICASDFEMLLINLSETAFSLPVYRTGIDLPSLYQRPEKLNEPYRMDIEPYRPYVFEAFSDIADMDFASAVAPLLIIHSKSRAAVTWVFERQTGEPLHLTDNDLQRSRIQIAVRVLGDIGSNRHLDTLQQLAQSDLDQVVRWEAAESIYKLNESQGIELLQQHLINDSNPSIAKAARMTLDNLTEEASP